MIATKVRLLFAGLIGISIAMVLALHAYGAQDKEHPNAPNIPIIGPTTELPPATGSTALMPTDCRYGVAQSYVYPNSDKWIATLNAGWYLNFGVAPIGTPSKSAEFAPVIRTRQNFIDHDNNPQTPPVRDNSYRFEPPLSDFYRNNNGTLLEGMGSIIRKYPGGYWIVGNEVDVDNAAQDNIMPELYAQAYHDAYYYIKGIDQSAKVAIAGLSMMTPGRLQYLSIVWDTYRSLYGHDMPVDIWNMHLYILEERMPGNPNDYGDGKIALGTDPALAKLSSGGDAQYCPAKGAADIPANDPRPDVYCRAEHDSVRIFREQVYALRQWMKDHGQQNKPLIITEFGILYPNTDLNPDGTCNFLLDEHQQCFNPTRVTTFLRNTMQFLMNTTDPNLGYPADGNRLVQQWLWYSLITGEESSGGSSNLLRADFSQFPAGDPAALTAMGEAFRQEASTNNFGQSNLVGGIANDVVLVAGTPGFNGTANLTATFRNGGTKSIVAPVTVTFYSDQALTQVIGSTTYYPETSGAIAGCTWGGRNSERVSVQWSNLQVGKYNYWAVIDSTNAIGETLENDNVTSRGTVTVVQNGIFVPTVRR